MAGFDPKRKVVATDSMSRIDVKGTLHYWVSAPSRQRATRSAKGPPINELASEGSERLPDHRPQIVGHLVELIRLADEPASKWHVFRPRSLTAGRYDQFHRRPPSSNVVGEL